jgi:hypothetical protein
MRSWLVCVPSGLFGVFGLFGLSALAVACAACSKTPPSPAASASASSSASAAPAVSSMAAPPATASAGIPDAAVLMGSTETGPVTPKLQLDFSAMGPGEWRVTAEGLPAVSDDGKVVALFLSKEDGARGYPNAGLLVKDVDTDKPVKELLVLVADEIYKAESAPNASGTTLPALQKTANDRLADAQKTLAAHSWLRMPWQMAPAPTEADMKRAAADAGPPAPPPIHVSGLVAQLASDRLVVKDSAGKSVVDEDAHAWRLKPKAQGKGMAPCAFEPALAEVAADPAHHVVVVHVIQMITSGGDGCSAVGAYHAYRLK